MVPIAGILSVKLRLSFGYASIVPGWEKWANKGDQYDPSDLALVKNKKARIAADL